MLLLFVFRIVVVAIVSIVVDAFFLIVAILVAAAFIAVIVLIDVAIFVVVVAFVISIIVVAIVFDCCCFIVLIVLAIIFVFVTPVVWIVVLFIVMSHTHWITVDITYKIKSEPNSIPNNNPKLYIVRYDVMRCHRFQGWPKLVMTEISKSDFFQESDALSYRAKNEVALIFLCQYYNNGELK